MSELSTPSHLLTGEDVRKGKWKGSITLHIYEDAPVQSQFEGILSGNDISFAWRGMMKGYRVWKANQLKEMEAKRGGN